MKTTVGNRTLVIEERQLMNGEERDKDFKMSLYEDGQLKTEQNADIQIPSVTVGLNDVTSAVLYAFFTH